MKELITILFILFTATLFSQVEYFINPYVVGGTQDGLSDANAFDSWEDVTFASNNTYRQKRGTIFNLTSYINVEGHSNVHLGVYGAGNDYAYIIDNRNTGDADYATINTGNVEGLLIDSLDLYGTNFPTFLITAGISLGKSEWSAVTNNDITIRDCNIRRYNWGIRGLTYLWSTEADTELNKFGDLEISRCKIDSCYDDGIFLQRIGGNTKTDTAFYIHHNHISKVNLQYPYVGTWAGDCIQYSATMTGVYIVSNNKLIRTTYEKFNVIFNSKGTGTAGLLKGDGATIIIEKNYIDAPETNASALYLTVHSLWSQNDSVQFIVRNNTFIGDGVNGIYFATDNTKAINNTYVYGNTFKGFATCTNSGAPTGSVYFYNNIFDGYTTHAIRHPSIAAKNNMFIGEGTGIITSGSWILDANTNWYTNLLDANITAKDSTGSIDFTDSTQYYNSVWMQDCNLTSGTQVRDYRVVSTSNTIDAGVDVSIMTYDNDSTIYTSTFDIGAYEYVSPSSPVVKNRIIIKYGNKIVKLK